MTRFHNRTRRASSIPRKLLLAGKLHLIPLYFLLRTSDLAREGMENSGSYRFADHIYAMKPSGRLFIGRIIDAVLLKLTSARALRARYVYAMQELRSLLLAAHRENRQLDVLAVPCGLARELFELAEELGPGSSVRLHGLDLDAALVGDLQRASRQKGMAISFHAGDALSPAQYGGTYDVMLSTGLTEFLDDADAVRFYRTMRNRLNPGGRLLTSGLARHALSDYLMRNLAELHTHYRSKADLRALAEAAGFRQIETYQDATGLQTMLVATKTRY